MRAAVYTRLSRLGPDGLETATERQYDDAEARALREGWEVVHRLTDSGISGYTGKHRAAFEQLLEIMSAGEVDVVVVWKIDRLTRNIWDHARFFKVADDHGVRLVSIADGIDTATAVGEAQATWLVSMAKMESQNTSTRIRRRQDELAKEGRRHGGPRLFGFQAGNEDHHPDEAALVAEVFRLYASGTTSYAKIADHLNARGATTTRGGPWASNRVKDMLTNRAYVGLLVRNGQVVGPGRWEPIVDQTTWDAVQSVIRQRTHAGYDGRAKSMLGGLATCGLCGAPLRVQQTPRRPHRYQCNPLARSTRPHDGRRPDHGCSRVVIDMRTLDLAVAGIVADAAPWVRVEAERSARASDSDYDDVAARLESLLRQQEALVHDAYVADPPLVPREAFLSANQALDRRIVEARGALQRLPANKAVAAIPDELASAALFLEMPVPAQRAIIDAIMSSIELLPANGKTFGPSDPLTRLRWCYRYEQGPWPAG